MKRLFTLFLLLTPFLTLGQTRLPHVTYLTKDSLSERTLYDNWRISTGDSAAMASVNYYDENWLIRSTGLYINNDTSWKIERLKNPVWMRLHVIIDSSLVGLPVVLPITHLGASEIYVDGKKIATFGEIKGKDSSVYFDPQFTPTVTQFESAGEHVIAVRYANFNAGRNYRIYNNSSPGFRMGIAVANRFIPNDRLQALSVTFIVTLLFGIFLALSLLHLFLFLYNREVLSNLYFSIFSLSLAVVFLLTFFQKYVTSPEIQLNSGFVALLAAAAACFSLSGFSNQLFSQKKLRFKIIAALCVLFIVIWFFNYLVAVYFYIAIVTVVTIESMVLTLTGIYNKVKGARIIGFGLLFFALFFLTLVVISVTVKTVNGDTIGGELLMLFGAASILSMPISMSVYLAWSFSSMNRDLKKQVHQISELSEQALQQEIEKKELLSRKNAELEQRVEERTSEVQHQKELVEIKNKAITDNLIYAQRIQSAILPDWDVISRSSLQSFVLYLPKDIVSGDFYSLNKVDDRLLIAAGDCTGHGVSGALMSVIGSSLLNQIINEKGISTPSEILNNLNRSVIETLKQSQNESNDGMDISVCSFDLEKRELQYAGANRPVYLIRSNALEVIKPDKLPIGGLQIASNRVFNNHVVPLQKNDTIYLFTDGFADQFGGPSNKKMMVARFKELLLSMQHMNMPDQRAHLNSYFENWKKENDQVDDVLVIGIRI